MIGYFFIGFIGVFLTALSQIILKLGAIKNASGSFIYFLINPYTIIGYTLMFLVTLINLYIFKVLDLKFALVFLPSSYILVLIFSVLILKEKIKKEKMVQYAIVMAGIILFNL